MEPRFFFGILKCYTLMLNIWKGRYVHSWHLDSAAPAFVRYWSECGAKLFAALRSRNNRIRLSSALNQCCALAFVLESILLVFVVKIVLQHIRSNSGHHAMSAFDP